MMHKAYFFSLLFKLFKDNELPDYVVVMVANKKSEAQMTEDLNLFLGENTVKFTSWSVMSSKQNFKFQTFITIGK